MKMISGRAMLLRVLHRTLMLLRFVQNEVFR